MKNHQSSIINHQSLIIGWLYPDLMNTYGDRGNILALQKRCEWRNIGVEIKRLNVGFNPKHLALCNLLFMGGAQDTQQMIVSRDFSTTNITLLKQLVETNTPGLYICGAYQFLGQYYKEANGNKIPGLGILDLHTEHPGENAERLIGNIIADSPLGKLVGFENHGGRTYISDKKLALGKVLKGFGNNGKDKTEGIKYKNSIGTYLHGPALPKNPKLADFLIQKALEKKYGKIKLKTLDDSLEQKAREAVLKDR
ncbi:MAG: glutamine amidotransferase [Candidatus Levyibacteriota bacterium]